MPIIDVRRARRVMVMKRRRGVGHSGVENPLFYYPRTRMRSGGAKNVLEELIRRVW
ncbi:NAD(P)(+) transhydrogenase (Re/Si-specific) subunit beta [Longimicrobium sp.]|uniref:NAD(P)(+) transhydrogenase (Re/Si-specific) subunit beta n=1 Tax=Longimicrobium sp. TaxID=2029185 RepID=UPI003B3B2531